MLEYVNPGIMNLAEANDISYAEAMQELKRNYDGYRFAEKGNDIYNPWSLLSRQKTISTS